MIIGIVILNYKTHEETSVLLNELQKQTIADNLHIVVVDNHSPNDSYLKLKPVEEKISNVNVIKTEANLGYAKGNNVGLRYLQEHVNPEYVAILNNDIELPDDCLENLAQKYKELDKPAIIAPMQLDSNGNELKPYRMNSYLDDCVNMFYIFKLFHKRNKLEYTDNTGRRAMKVEMIPGSFMFTSFERFKSMGFFYPGTFLFEEERFIAMKVKEMGLQNYILLDESYVHAHSKTINMAYNQIGKYKLLYDSCLEFTCECRPNGKFKAKLLKVLSRWSLLEMKVVNSVRSLFT